MEMSGTTFIPGNVMLIKKMVINSKLVFILEFGIYIYIFLFRSCVRKLSKRDALPKPMAYKVHLAGLRPVTMCLGKKSIIRKNMKFLKAKAFGEF